MLEKFKNKKINRAVFLCLTVLLCSSFVIFGMEKSAFAEETSGDVVKKIGGEWHYRYVILEREINIAGTSYDFELVEESGDMTISVKISDNKEVFEKFALKGAGKYLYRETGKTKVWTEKNYTIDFSSGMEASVYNPEAENEFIFNDGTNVMGLPIQKAFKVKQTGDNTLTGTVTLTFGGQAVSSDITATRTPEPPYGGSPGMCNAGFAGLALLLGIPVVALNLKKRK